MGRTDVKHFQLRTSTFHGIYRGVIEDNNDPEMLGRVRVRIWGVHDEKKTSDQLEGIPTANLPWAEPCLGLIEGSVSGFGLFSVPLQGSHVFVFFEGGNWECPRYFGTSPGKPEAGSDTSLGFNDPAGEYPKSNRVGESDYHRLARGQSSGTIVDHKNANVDTDVPKAGGETWTEPNSAYAAQYPHNIVLHTHSGILIEVDNTSGAERVHLFHPSNTYIEIDHLGNVVFRNDGDRFEITNQTRNKHILIDDNETINANKTSKVGTDETREVGNDQDEKIGQNRKTAVGRNDTKTVGQDWSVKVGGNIRIEADGNVTIIGARIDLNP